ncbi:hemin transporter HemP [Burkholderia ubonensis]|uniref:Hemin transporter HemP n=1 Tax=Burkholderia ubonensis TaxID=101571 RepID=A0A118HTX0_9BURK|nr:hemin uptake protein HemP [Burkholderia ubonensis]AOJ63278.1 hemin transporter HemP [Burkholderia ubonensis]KVG68555.1 hemin transporter HemP [Burkholderia ubonensis]
MTDTTRSSTLTLRRTTAPGGSRQKTAAVTTPAKPVVASRDAGTRVVNSDALLQGRSHVSIAHNGETYQLRATRLGKLILTK